MLYTSGNNLSSSTSNQFMQVPTNPNRRSSDNSGRINKISNDVTPIISNVKGSVSWQNLEHGNPKHADKISPKLFDKHSQNENDSQKSILKSFNESPTRQETINTNKNESNLQASTNNIIAPPTQIHNSIIFTTSSPSSSTASSTTSSTSSFASTSLCVNANATNSSVKLNTLPIILKSSSSNERLNINLDEQNSITNDSIDASIFVNNADLDINCKKNHSQVTQNTNSITLSQLNSINASTTLLNSQTVVPIPQSNSPDSYRKSIQSGTVKDSTYKKQKENYLTEKRRITNDMLTIMRDETIIVLADWLKIRGSLKNWIKLYVILKPGIMLLFKSDKMKPGQWVGTIILNSCQLLERPSKKHGFCFKLFHPLERSIWASKGPAGETYINVPYMLLPTFYLIFRAPSENIGNIWMEAIELTLKSGHLLKPSTSIYHSSLISQNSTMNGLQLNESIRSNNSALNLTTNTTLQATKKNKNPNSVSSLHTTNFQSMIKEAGNELNISLLNQDIESKHFKDISDNNEEERVALSDSDNGKNNSSDEICSLNSSNDNLEDEYFDDNDNGAAIVEHILSTKTNNQKVKLDANYNEEDECEPTLIETKYVPSPKEEFGELGNKDQTEEVGEENKSLIFCLVKQVRPGMDLSKVVLPTFILEPRSFLEKLTDFYYHSDLLSESINNDDPYERIKSVVKFYLSGFYKKPKGLKKPYNPILGEVFRSYWYNPKTDSKTFYIAEQVSHHPPITSFYVINRKEGFCIYGTILARSKFYGNSVSAIMDGNVKLILLNRGEEYNVTLPYANCKGILIGKLTMELGGKINIECAKTGYSAEIEFKLKPLLGGIEASNIIDGKIKFAKETIAVMHGKWDGEIILQEKNIVDQQHKQIVLWNPTKQIIESRLKRFIVAFENQMEFESEKLWAKVSEAIRNCDQNLATEEKTKIELRQREKDQERKTKFIEYKSKFFTYDSINKEWLYNYTDLRPWDNLTDLFQYECDFRINTSTKHNLNKINTQTISDPRSSLLSLRHHNHHQTPHLRHPRQSQISNNEEASYDFLVHFNDVKHRLEKIEDNLKRLNNKLEEASSNFSLKSQYASKPILNNKLARENEYIHYLGLTCTRNVLKSPATIIFLIAWIFGLFTAICSKRLFSVFS